MKYNLICILGPTASGKTVLAANLAYITGGEIISADSRQVYRGMNIGTGKDYSDYFVKGMQIPVHLIDIVDAGTEYNVFRYQQDFISSYRTITARGHLPVLCGGTGMYIQAVLSGYKLINVPHDERLREILADVPDEILINKLRSYKNLHNTTDITQRKRLIRAIEIEEYYLDHPASDEYPDLNPLVAGIMTDRDTRRKRITERLDLRLKNGMVEEVVKLMDTGITADKLIYYGLEYKYITLYLTGKLSWQDMYNQLNTAIHQFAKRQMTWFRKMEREGIRINWLDGKMSTDEMVESILNTGSAV